ncbi:uncharacterized protein [Euwallacea fornicatus]|uniref:uncharacterized protein n=1 Tax=Euwallacea fornicatus TaxID=995702 RepID=UPI00338D9B0C
MAYTTLLLMLMCLGASDSVHLTKEIFLAPVPQSPQVSQFSNIISHLLQPSEAIVSSLVTLLSSNTEPKVPDILDAVNSGLGLKLLIIVDDAVQLDAVKLETALVRVASDVAEALYPKDYVKQMATYAAMQNKAFEFTEQFQKTIAATKVPVRRFEEILESRHVLMKRDVQERDIFSDIIDSVIKSIQSTICGKIVSEVQTFINLTLSNWVTTLEDIDVESTGDPLSNILSYVVELGIFFMEQGINCSNQWLENHANNVCTSLLIPANDTSSDTAVRKRRQVNEAPSSVMSRNVFNIFGGIWGLLWSLISIPMNFILKIVVNNGLSLLKVFLDNLIDSTFHPLF